MDIAAGVTLEDAVAQASAMGPTKRALADQPDDVRSPAIESIRQALQNMPDLRAAQQGVTAARSQYGLQKAIGKQDVTVQGNYSHVNGINAANVLGSIPLPIFNRNQGEIARTRFAISTVRSV